MSYDEDRDRNLAGPGSEAEFVLTATDALTKALPVKTGGCERPTCTKHAKFWVQRGPIGIIVCGPHLSTAVRDLHEIKPGRYGKSEHYEGYWISTHHTIKVKMRVGEGWR